MELRGKVAEGHVILEVEDWCGGLAPGKVEQAAAHALGLTPRMRAGDRVYQ